MPRRDLSAKKTKPNIEKCPESLGVMLEFQGIPNVGFCAKIYQSKFQTFVYFSLPMLPIIVGNEK